LCCSTRPNKERESEEAAAEADEEEEEAETGSEPAGSSHRPQRLARDLIDDEAMEPSGQVELPAGVPRSAFTSSSHTARSAVAAFPGGPSGTLSRFSALNSSSYASVSGRGGDAEAAAQAEVLGEELKKEGNQLYNEGQLEAAELVYTEALKVSTRALVWLGAAAARAVQYRHSHTQCTRKLAPLSAALLLRTAACGHRLARSCEPGVWAGGCARVRVMRSHTASQFAPWQYAPKNYVIYSNRSMCLGRLGKFGDALTDARTVVAMMPTWAKGFARLAASLEALRKDSEAIAAYEKARWLASAHDNDPAGEAEYAEACAALRHRSAMSGAEGNDGFS